MLKRRLSILLLLILANFTLAQRDTAINDLINIETFLEESESEETESFIFDHIEELLRNPINLNSADIDELLQIPFLDYGAANEIVTYRKKYGYFITKGELYAIDKFDPEIIEKIAPFIYIDSSLGDVEIKESISDMFLNRISLEMRNRLQNDLQTKKGYINGNFEGSKIKSYNRAIIKSGENLQIGFLTEKDPGEKRYNDFVSYNFTLKNAGIIQRAVFGDYLMEFGQGLVLWGPYGFSKGGDVIQAAQKKNRNIIPYTSADENQFFRGAAASIILNNFKIAPFYSNNNFDARIEPSINEIQSIPIDGYHRTQNEIQRKNAGKAVAYGGRIDYKVSDFGEIGALYFNYKIDPKIANKSIYALAGNNFDYYSAAYKFYFSGVSFFGETASNGSSAATLNGLQLLFSKNISFIVTIRNYPKDFTSIKGFPFGESSAGTQNERGVYWGLKYRTNYGIFQAYFDNFHFPYSNYYSFLPSKGYEFMLDYLTKPIKNIQLNIRYKNENKEIGQAIENELKLVNRLTHSLRAEISFIASKELRFRTRYEVKNYFIKSNLNEFGYTTYQDIRYASSQKIAIYGRIIFFETESYNSRIYEYENDLPGIMSNMALYGSGVRWYLAFSYRPYNFISIGLKYSETYKPKEIKISSGNSEIDGNLDNKISIQIDWKF